MIEAMATAHIPAVRSGQSLIDLARRGDLDVTAVTAAEEAGLRAYSRSQTEKLQAQICNPLQNAETCRSWKRKARNKLHLFLKSPAARLYALYRAEKRTPKACRMSLGERLSLLAEVDVRRVAKPATYSKLKRPGSAETRQITKFDVLDRARQTLLRLALTPFARACPERSCDPSQALTFGGSSTACEALRAALVQAPACAWFLHLDVRGYYDAIAVEILGEITGLPPEVIHSQIAPRDRSRGEKRILSPVLSMQTVEAHPPADTDVTSAQAAEESAIDGGHAARSDRRYLPQGSAASPTIAELVMGRILRDVGTLEGVLWLAVYSDNVGVLAPSQEVALAVKDRLTGVFETHPSGPYQLTSNSCPIISPFRFLGYHWLRAASEVVTTPARLRLWTQSFNEELLRVYDSEDVAEAVKLFRSVGAFIGAFPLWLGTRRARWQEHRERSALMIFDDLCAADGVDPASILTGGEMSKLSTARKLDLQRQDYHRWKAEVLAA